MHASATKTLWWGDWFVYLWRRSTGCAAVAHDWNGLSIQPQYGGPNNVFWYHLAVIGHCAVRRFPVGRSLDCCVRGYSAHEPLGCAEPALKAH